MKKLGSIILSILLVLGSMLLSGCYFWPDNSFDKLAPPPVAAPSPPVYNTYVVKRSTLFATRSFSGNFLYATADTIDLKTPPANASYREQVNFSTVNVKKGDAVAKGAVLAKLDTSGLETFILTTQNEYQALLISYQNALSSNQTELAAAIKIQSDAKKKQYDLAVKDRQLYTITAPYDCIISDITGGKGLATAMKIYDPTSFALINSSTANTMALKVGDEGIITVLVPNQTDPSSIKAKLAAVPQADAATGTNDARFVAVVTDGFDTSLITYASPGTFTVTDGQTDNVLMIPKSAVLNFGAGKTIVRVLDSSGISKGEKLVTLGAESGLYVEVLDGLSEGDVIVLNDTNPAVTANKVATTPTVRPFPTTIPRS